MLHKSEAEWHGTLKNGKGSFQIKGITGQFPFTYASRFEEAEGTNPEALIAAAHAGCFSQAFSMALEKAGFTPESIHTTASVMLEKHGDSFAITKIDLDVSASVPGIEEERFNKIAHKAKDDCLVSRALSGVKKITVNARLLVAAN